MNKEGNEILKKAKSSLGWEKISHVKPSI